MRLPFAQPLTTRDGTLNKDSKVVNGYVESKGEQSAVFKRPGTTVYLSGSAGTGQGAACWNNRTRIVVNDVLQTINIDSSVSSFGATKTTGVLVNSSWQRVKYGNSRWIAINSAGKYAMSTDLVTWAEGALASGGNYSGLAYGNGIFCAVGYSAAKSFTTTDGITWSTSGTFPLSGGPLVMEYSAGLFCSCQSGGAFTSYATSPDGITWTSRTFSSRAVVSMATGNGVLIATSVISSVWYASRSTNGGISFSEVALPVSGSGNYFVAYGNGVFVAVKGSTSNSIAAVSTDYGQTWIQTAMPVASTWVEVTHNGKIFVAISGSSSTVAATSPDGFNWTQQTMPTGAAGYWSQAFGSNMTGTSVTLNGTEQCVITPTTTTGVTSATIPPSETGLPYDMIPMSGNGTPQYLMLKNTKQGFVFDGATVTAISDADYPQITVRGLAFLDGYFFVMDQQAKIWGSDLNDPTSWNALNFVTAAIEPGAGVAIAKSQNYVVAFKEWSTEFFYDNANPPPGSPLSPVLTNFTLVGCASGDSVAQVDKYTFWIAQTKQLGRQVYMMVGDQQQAISTPDVERVIGTDDLDTVYAMGLRIGGHAFYLVSLVTTNITLVYDVDGQTWYQWSSLTAAASKSVSSITRSGTTATVTTSTAHGLSDGDPVTIAGANQAAYNGTFQIKYVSTVAFTIEVAGSPTTPATGTITSTGYTEVYWQYSNYVHCNNKDLLLGISDGDLYEFKKSYYTDNDIPINVLIRTGKFDGGSTQPKREGRCEVIGNKIDDIGMIRHSDDDYQTNSAYRIVDLGAERSQIWRQGRFRRRSYEFRYIGNNQLQVSNLELDLE